LHSTPFDPRLEPQTGSLGLTDRLAREDEEVQLRGAAVLHCHHLAVQRGFKVKDPLREKGGERVAEQGEEPRFSTATTWRCSVASRSRILFGRRGVRGWRNRVKMAPL
jgi:hypothetical protein